MNFHFFIYDFSFIKLSVNENPDLSNDQKSIIKMKLMKIVLKKVMKLCESLFAYDKLNW